MTRRPVTSTAIRSIGHAGDILEVEFANGVVHQYTGVPREVHDHLVTAKSVGARFAAQIRGKYPHVCTHIPGKTS